MTVTSLMHLEPQQLRHAIQNSQSREMRLRRGVVGTSLLGMASMAIVTLLQSGILKHLKDPPRGNFKTDKVNSSDEASSMR